MREIIVQQIKSSENYLAMLKRDLVQYDERHTFGSKEGEKAGDFGSSIGEMPVTPDLAIVETDDDAAKLRKSNERVRRDMETLRRMKK